MTRKELPAVITLLACAFTSLFTYFKGYGLKTMTIALLAVFVLFYFLGSVIKMILDSFYKENERRKAEEGEVIEKEPSGDEPENPEGTLINKTEEKSDNAGQS